MAQRQLGDRLHARQRVLDPMVQLADQELLGRLRLLALGDVDQHVHRPDQSAGLVAQGRRVRDERHAAAVRALGRRLGAPHRPVLLQCHGHRALVVRQRRAVRLIQTPGAAPLAAAQLGPAAPKLDGGLVVEGDATRFVGRVDRRWERLEQLAEAPLALAQPFFGPRTFGDVVKAAYAAHAGTIRVGHGVKIRKDGDACAVRPLEDDLTVADCLAQAQKLRHRRLLPRQRSAVGPEPPPGAAVADVGRRPASATGPTAGRHAGCNGPGYRGGRRCRGRPAIASRSPFHMCSNGSDVTAPTGAGAA